MKKALFSLFIVMSYVTTMLTIAETTLEQKITTSKYYNAEHAQYIEIFFNYTKERLTELPTEIAQAQQENPIDTDKLEYLQEQLKTYRIINLIAERNTEALKNLSLQDLQLKYKQIEVPGERFKNIDDVELRTLAQEDRLVSCILAGENALAFALFHAATNKIESDHTLTLAILEILLNKGLNPNCQTGFVEWVKDNPATNRMLDYVRFYRCAQVALTHSSPEVLKLLLEHGATFGDNIDINNIITAIKEAKNSPKYSYFADFEPILATCTPQSTSK